MATLFINNLNKIQGRLGYFGVFLLGVIAVGPSFHLLFSASITVILKNWYSGLLLLFVFCCSAGITAFLFTANYIKEKKENLISKLDGNASSYTRPVWLSTIEVEAHLAESVRDRTMAWARFGVWLLPTIGFIGTILGIREGFYVFSENEVNAIHAQNTMKVFYDEFSVAFESTLIAMVFAALLYAIIIFLEYLIDNVLEQSQSKLVNISSSIPNDSDDKLSKNISVLSRALNEISQFDLPSLSTRIHEFINKQENIIEKMDALEELRKTTVEISEDFSGIIASANRIEKAIQELPKTKQVDEINDRISEIFTNVSKDMSNIVHVAAEKILTDFSDKFSVINSNENRIERNIKTGISEVKGEVGSNNQSIVDYLETAFDRLNDSQSMIDKSYSNQLSLIKEELESIQSGIRKLKQPPRTR